MKENCTKKRETKEERERERENECDIDKEIFKKSEV